MLEEYPSRPCLNKLQYRHLRIPGHNQLWRFQCKRFHYHQSENHWGSKVVRNLQTRTDVSHFINREIIIISFSVFHSYFNLAYIHKVIKLLMHLCVVDTSVSTLWTGPFLIIGSSG